MRLDRLWIRVPLYVGDRARVRPTEPATVQGLASSAPGTTFSARPITAPPSADPTSASVDLYYAIDATNPLLQPGERVSVTLPLASETEHTLVVPLAAVVRDLSGGSWVYERTDSVTFARRRIEVARVVDGSAVLAAGPAVGTAIVVAGAAELFGTEFGAGK